MTLIQTLITAEELWRLPDDGQRHELVGGELRTMPPSGEEHGTIAAETGFLLTTNPDTVRAPDVACISHQRVGPAGPARGYRRGAPDLVAEVIAPTDLYTAVAEKVATWLAHGTRMVLVLNPRGRTVTVHRSPTQVRQLTVTDTLDGEDVVPGWSMPVRDLFPPGS